MTDTNWISRTARRLTGKPDRDPTPAAEAEPCIPCAQKKGVRQFSLNVPEVMIDESEIPVLAPDVAFTIVDSSVLLYQTSAGTSHVLNATAALIWAAIGDDLTVGDIIDRLAETAGLERSAIATDVRTTLSQFDTAGITSSLSASRPPNGSTTDARVSMLPRALDDHPWAATIGPVSAASAHVVVRTDSDEVAALVAPLLAALPRHDDSDQHTLVNISIARRRGGRRPFRLYVDGERRAVWATADQTPAEVQVQLNRVATEVPGGRLLLHAGAVERDGNVIVIAGDSGRGKSTLTSRLVQRGFAYLTDEVAAVQANSFDVLPYPKLLSLDATALHLLGLTADADVSGKELVSAGRLGEISSGGTARLIVILGEEPLAQGGEVMAPGVARMLDMLSCTFLSTFDDADALDALNDFVSRVPILRLGRGDLDGSCDRIEAELSALANDATTATA